MKTYHYFINPSIFYVCIICLFTASHNMAAVEISSSVYEWKSVEMVGGGFVSGIVFHPKAKDVCYCRTDMGGAYRRNAETMRWEPLLDWLKYGDPVNSNQLKPDFEKPKEIRGMKLVWNEDFNNNGKPDSASWGHEIGFVRNEEMQWYQPQNAVCKDGLLIIEGNREQFDNPNYQEGSSNWKNNRQKVNYTSSSINTRGKKNWLYGRFEVRARIDSSMGSWPAIWALGIDKPWPSNGEIDMMEFYRVNNVPTILANVAWGTNQRYVAKWDGEKRPLKFFTDADPDWVKKFHIWRMDWDKENIKLYLDDVLLNVCPLSQTINPDGTNPFTKPQYLLLNLALGSNGGDPENTRFPLKFEVDYVRVYQE